MKLVELTPSDIDWVASVVELWKPSQRWSLRGATLSPELLQRLVVDNVAFQRIAVTDGGVRLAVFQVADVDAWSGHGEAGVLANPEHYELVAAGAGDFVKAAFGELRLRKLCVGADADGVDVHRCFGAIAEQVGRLIGHERRGADLYVDLLLYEIWRASVPCHEKTW